MACETKELELKFSDGSVRKLTVQQLPAMKSVKLLARLGRVLGTGLGLLATGDESKVGEAIPAIFEKLNEAEAEHMIDALLFTGGLIEVKGQQLPIKDVFNIEFSGQMAAVIRALVFALKVNYGDFSAALGDLGALLPMGKRSGSNTSTTSSGAQSA